ncbi:cation:proton antiporter [Candidatus Bipolaricaulota bacterium]|nr:cation:proton antiporter [Candidatus Bipolaricaulota bacterium]
MNGLLATGLAIMLGYVLGELVRRLGLPRVSGYIIAGLILNPRITGIVSSPFVASMGTTTELSLAVLTFAIGGTLAFGPLRELGKKIIFIALGEAQLAAFLVTAGCMATLPFILPDSSGFWTTIAPLAILLGSLASPTDPSATLAVVRQYKAKGMVTFSIMASAAIDDALGILNYSLGIVVALVLITHHVEGIKTIFEPLVAIGGAVGVGIVSGLAFRFAPRWLRGESDGLQIALLLGLLGICYGASAALGLDQLLATMAMGATVVNASSRQERHRVFMLLEESVEPVIFIVFFTVSGMLLDVAVLFQYLPVVLVFVIFRSFGKLGGAYLGARLGRASREVRRYTGWGLIPQGGIVIGLALILQQEASFASISHIVLNVIIGATVIHELIGPLTAKLAIMRAGEAERSR